MMVRSCIYGTLVSAQGASLWKPHVKTQECTITPPSFRTSNEDQFPQLLQAIVLTSAAIQMELREAPTRRAMLSYDDRLSRTAIAD